MNHPIVKQKSIYHAIGAEQQRNNALRQRHRNADICQSNAHIDDRRAKYIQRSRKKRSHTCKLKNQNSNNVMKMRQCQIGPDIERNIDKLLYAHQQQGRRGNRMPICLHTFFCTGLIDRQEKLKQRPQQQQRQKQLRYYLFLFVNNYFPFYVLDIFYLMRYGIDTDYGPQGITTVHDFSCCRYPFFRFGGILCI